MNHRSLMVAMATLLIVPLASGAPDAVGDHEIAVATLSGNGWVALGRSGPYQDMDLLDLAITDDPESITFQLTAASMQAGPDPFRSDIDITAWIRFAIDDHGYQIKLWEEGGANPWLAELHRIIDDQPFPLGRITIQHSDAGFYVDAPREWLRDGEGNIPAAGERLHSIRTSLLGQQIGGFQCPDDEPVAICAIKVRDEHPNTGTLDAYLLTTESGQTYGHIQLTSANPIRASNGEATTYIFEARLKNLGTSPDTLHFTVGEQPAGWTVHGPERLSIGAGETQRYAIAVSVPFSHQHGVTRTLNVTISSDQDPSLAAYTRFGVEWINPPQPAGHHDTLYLHYGNGGSNGLSMDTLWRDDPQTPNLFSYTSRNGTAIDIEANRLDIPLLPGLLIGIDADPTRVGEATIVLDSPHAGSYGLDVDFWYHPNPQEPDPLPRRLFAIDQATVDITQGRNVLELPIEVLAAGDYVALHRPGGLTLDIRLTRSHPGSDFTPGVGAQLDFQIVTEETQFRLPLFEYHDPVPVDAAGALRLDATTQLELRRAPGATGIFTFQVLGAAGPIIVDTSPGFSATTFNDGEVLFVEVAYVVPSDFEAGANVDGVVTIIDEASGAQAFAVVRVVVDPSATDDDLVRQATGRDRATPAVGIVAILVGLGIGRRGGCA